MQAEVVTWEALMWYRWIFIWFYWSILVKLGHEYIYLIVIKWTARKVKNSHKENLKKGGLEALDGALDTGDCRSSSRPFLMLRGRLCSLRSPSLYTYWHWTPLWHTVDNERSTFQEFVGRVGPGVVVSPLISPKHAKFTAINWVAGECVEIYRRRTSERREPSNVAR